MNHRLLRPRRRAAGSQYLLTQDGERLLTEAGEELMTDDGVFDPRSISGLEAWWDAADASSVTLDGGRVASLADKSGNSKNAINNTSGSTQPDYIINAINGRNVVRYSSASSQTLVSGTTSDWNFIHNGSDASLYIVFDWAEGPLPQRITGTALFSNSVGFYLVALTSSLQFNVFRGVIGSPAVQLNTGNNTFTTGVSLVQIEVDADDAVSADRASLALNGVEYATNSETNAPSSANSTTGFFLGNPFDGDICECLVYSSRHSEEEKIAIQQYLAAKWGVTLP